MHETMHVSCVEHKGSLSRQVSVTFVSRCQLLMVPLIDVNKDGQRVLASSQVAQVTLLETEQQVLNYWPDNDSLQTTNSD